MIKFLATVMPMKKLETTIVDEKIR